MKELKVNIDTIGNNYTIYIDNNIDKLHQALVEHKIKTNSNIFLITDDKVYSLYRNYIEKIKEKYTIKVYYVNNGERSKNINTIQGIYSFLIENNANRDSVLIALGGGVVSDIVGFVASTYMRGIRYINVPTTLLSQVDSCMGGKVGFNFNGLKNVIGNFYNPYFVYISTNFLKSLDQRHFTDGLGEIVKYALIKDNSLFNYLNENYKGILEKENDKMAYIVRNCLKLKKAIVEQDFKDRGIRQFLNFGHTVGHGIEMTSGGKLTHGECVALGILVSLKLSEKIFGLKKEVYIKTIELYKKIGLPIKYKVDNYNLFMYAINHDKKNNDKIRFILLQNVEKGVIKVEVNKEQLLQGIEESISKGE
ncbi:3-dehydroquinate synthase [Clostridium tetanomorphum]|uniref:3-dehydroquinate synthase n=1 Tax=Clostridium tetanomorphum TaxID=1553 RepID=A0A923IYQ2_CLOTT|nr:3-dehydroquinate synthase [Clostridium tetanomorphum]MBC2396611.1 3-dehydroquinate synthase [Clostridium tetanomorphum]NRZ98235.1 3-dehydroquinate synthase [Clostridium tetanomorphum]